MTERWPGELREDSPERTTDNEQPAFESDGFKAVPASDEVAAAEAPQHAAGMLDIPDDVDVLAGEPGPLRRSIAIVISKFNGEITSKLLQSALDELDGLEVE